MFRGDRRRLTIGPFLAAFLAASISAAPRIMGPGAGQAATSGDFHAYLARSSAGKPVAISNVRLVPMTKNTVIPGQTVLVAGGLITKVGPSRRVAIPPDAVVIDGGGAFLVPGLADMHTHLNDSMFEHPFFNLFLANGVTTIRDLAQGSPPMVLHQRHEIESGKRLGPHILTAFTLWGWEKDVPGLVAGQSSLGYDCLKINSYFSPADFEAAMRVAKARRWYTIGHIPQFVRLEGVLAAGMNELSHIEELIIFELLGMDWSKVTDSDSFDTQLVDLFHAAGKKYLNASAAEIQAAFGDKVCRAVDKLKGSPIQLTTTMIIHEDTLNKLTDLGKIRAARHAKYAAPQFWEDIAAGKDKHQQMVVKGEERAWFLVYELQNMLLRELKAAAVPLVLGTDTGPTYLSLVPGFSVHDELRLLTENGFSPYEAIALATRRAGETAGAMTGRNDFGTIEVGKRADLVLLEQNPLADVANLRSPLGVMAGGRWLPREALDQLLEIRHSPILASLKSACVEGGADAALELYRRLTNDNLVNEHRYGPGTLIQIGNQLMEAGKVDDALRVYRFNTEEYPADPNAFIGLGEACQKAGRKDEAVKSFERALAIDPGQSKLKDLLRQIREQ